MSKGISLTSDVDGAYLMSCINRFWKITLPLETAMSTPTAKALSFTILNFKFPLRGSQSDKKLIAPRIKFSPPVSKVIFKTSGLVIRKLAGENISKYLAM